MVTQIRSIQGRLKQSEQMPEEPEPGPLPRDFMNSVVIQVISKLYGMTMITKILRRESAENSRAGAIGVFDDQLQPDERRGETRATLVPGQHYLYESRLLVQAGERPSPIHPTTMIKSPACVAGDECVGISMQLHGLSESNPGRTLMSWMSEDELDRHERTGEVPTDVYPCLLCCRYITQTALHEFVTAKEAVDPVLIFQSFYNFVDVPGEYKRTCCHIPDPSQYNGLMLPIAAFRHDLLFAYFDSRGLMHVDQSAMRVPLDRDQLLSQSKSALNTSVLYGVHDAPNYTSPVSAFEQVSASASSASASAAALPESASDKKKKKAAAKRGSSSTHTTPPKKKRKKGTRNKVLDASGDRSPNF